MIIRGVQDNQIYGADSPLYFSVLAGINETIRAVDLLITVWSGDRITDAPLDATYSLSRTVDSFGSKATATEFNVAPFAKDVLEFDTFTGNYSTGAACWMDIEYYIDYLDASQNSQSILSSITIVCTNGYGFFTQEPNYILDPFRVVSSDINATIGSTLKIPVLCTGITGGATKSISSVTATYSDGTTTTVNLPSVTDTTLDLFETISFNVTDVEWIDIESDVPSYGKMRVHPKKPYVYDPVRVGYLDANGSISYITFFGNNKEVSNYTRESHRVYRGGDYSANKGNKRVFRTNGTESITLNTDWVEEDMFNAIDELLLSKYVFLEVESLGCGLDFAEKVQADGGVYEGGSCVVTKTAELGIDITSLRTDPVYEVSDRISIIPNTDSINKIKSIDELINYEISFDKAFTKKPTYL